MLRRSGAAARRESASPLESVYGLVSRTGSELEEAGTKTREASLHTELNGLIHTLSSSAVSCCRTLLELMGSLSAAPPPTAPPGAPAFMAVSVPPRMPSCCLPFSLSPAAAGALAVEASSRCCCTASARELWPVCAIQGVPAVAHVAWEASGGEHVCGAGRRGTCGRLQGLGGPASSQ